jgi:hypothetical protein
MAEGIKNMSINKHKWYNVNLFIINNHPVKARHVIAGILAAPIVYSALYTLMSV